MKKKMITLGLIAGSLMLFSCGTAEPNQEATAAETEVQEEETTEPAAEEGVMEQGGIRLYEANIAQEFPDAELTLASPTVESVTAAGNQSFTFEVANYELATQTTGADERHCANSAKGQHIHFILNNAPYQAKYEPNFEAELMEGNNVVLAFLSRSYHESIKNGKAFVIQNFKVGETEDDFDAAAAHLFYSRPKGTYKGADTQKILLDFYLLNAELAEDGHKVKATINGNEFVLSKWAPYFIEGLQMGENTFRLQLIDAEGNAVPGPFNDSGERTITLAEAEAAS